MQEQVKFWLLVIIVGFSITELNSRRTGDGKVIHMWSEQGQGWKLIFLPLLLNHYVNIG